MPKQINLVFKGYYISKDALPHYGGVYFVYRGIHNKITDKVELSELMYIGEAEDIYERHQTHERQNDFENRLQKGEIIIYSCAPVSNEDRKRAECGLIYKQQPPLNDKCTCSFDYPQTEFFLSGACDLFKSKHFTLQSYEHQC